MLYNYRGSLIRVLDGDTIRVTIDYGLDQRGDYISRGQLWSVDPLEAKGRAKPQRLTSWSS